MKEKYNFIDILDKEGKNRNFINGKKYSNNYIELAKYWSKLPLYTDVKNIELFFNLLETKQVILLISGTGSGKTVFVPKFFYKYILINKLEGRIAVTNPKQLTTFNNADYGAKTLDIKLGDEVGYKYKNSPSESVSDITRLLYVTDGYILTLAKSKDKLLSEYIGIIVDEAHERNVQIDFLLKYLKDIVLIRPEFKVIIMSATINADVFKNYYDIDKIKYGQIEISGSPNFPIDRIWAHESYEHYIENYLKIALQKCIEILNSDKKDMIIFVPTTRDTTTGCIILKNRNINSLCLEIHAKTSVENKELAVTKNISDTPKVLMSTNVAESSITFDGLIYVIDTGLELVNHFDSINGTQKIMKTFTSQSQIIQRIGRVGRTMPGIAYHLYTEEEFKGFNIYPEPNIITTDITSEILNLFKIYNVDNLQQFLNDLITIPTQSQIDYSINKLFFYKCIGFPGEHPGRITSIGKAILKISDIDLISAYAIILSKYLNCQKEMIIIMGILNYIDFTLDKLFDYIKLNEFRKYIHKHSYDNSDHLTIYNIYQKLYKKNKYTYLNVKTFQNIDKLISNIYKGVNKLTDNDYDYLNKYELITIPPFDNLDNNILYVLYKAYQFNLIKNNTTINFTNNIEGKLDFHTATVVNLNNDNYTIAHGIINRFGKQLFTCCTEIPNAFIK